MKRIKGLNNQVNPTDQPQGTYRHAKNAVINTDKLAIESELGHTLFSKPDIDGTIVGNVVLDDGRIVIFLDQGKSTGTGSLNSEIGLYNPQTAAYSTVFSDQICIEKLNFKAEQQIEAEYKIDATDTVKIYWTDDYNPPRQMSITSPPIPTAGLSMDVTFDLFPKIDKYPKIILDSVLSGGTLNTGTWYVSCQLATEEGAVTNVLDISNPIYINTDHEQASDSPFDKTTEYATNIYNGAKANSTSGKKIKVIFHNVDTTYRYLRPIVINVINGVTSAFSIADVPIVSASVSVEITGLEAASTFSLPEVQIPKANYTKAKSISQVDDVLYLGNVVREKVDIGYQKYANSIVVEAKQVNPNHSSSITHNTGGIIASTVTNSTFGRDAYDNYYFKGYQRDEAYAFYITWILRDGSETVAYHIPGRPAVTSGGVSETDTVTSSTTIAPSAGMSAFPSHKVFHTYTGTSSTSVNANGMGYWENETEFYPSSGEDWEVWTVDAAGNGQSTGTDLYGKNVRHHRFPAENQGGGYIYSTSDTSFIDAVRFNPMGFRVKNVPYPIEISDKVLGYKVYYAKRTAQDALVLDYGLVSNHRLGSTPFTDEIELRPFSTCSGTGDTTNVDDLKDLTFDGLHTLTTLDSIERANAIKATRWQRLGAQYSSSLFYARGVTHFTSNSEGISNVSNRAMRFFIDYQRYGPLEYLASTTNQGSNTPLEDYGWAGGSEPNSSIAPITSKGYVPGNTIVSGTSLGISPNLNNLKGSHTVYVRTDEPIFSYGGFNPGSSNSLFNGMGSLFADTYGHTGAGITSSTVFGEDEKTLTSTLPGHCAVFGTLFAISSDIYKNFTSQTRLVYTGYMQHLNTTAPGLLHAGGSTTIFGGDTFLGLVAITKKRTLVLHSFSTSTSTGIHPLGGPIQGSSGVGGDEYYEHGTHLMAVESRTHPALRNMDTEIRESYYFPNVERNHKNLVQTFTGPMQYLYNSDYSTINTNRILSPADSTNVLQTLEDFPTRIIRSVKYNQSGMRDNFRIFLAGQYRDLPRHRGELWRLESFKSILIPHMERTLMMTRGKEELQVGAVQAALGSGDLFERDPVEVLTTERGLGGTQSQFAGVVTKNGYFFVDSDAGKVFMLSDQLEEISSYGMREWFSDNLKQPLWDYGMPRNADIPNVNIGATAAYDPKFRRILLTYHVLKPRLVFTTAYTAGNLTWDVTENRYVNNLGVFIPMDNDNFLGENGYFEKVSWTVSYYPELKAWGSFHDYVPNSYAYTTSNIYSFYVSGTSSTTMDTQLATHHSLTVAPGKFLTQGDFEFEYIDNTSPADNKIFSSIQWKADVEDVGTSKRHHSPGFTKFFVYNTTQMSDLTALARVDGSFISGVSNTRKTNQWWSTNDFRDDAKIVTQSATSETTNAVEMFSVTGSAQNIGQNTAYLDLTKPYHERKKFIDRYLGVRLVDDSSNSARKFISLYLTDAYKRKNYR